MSFSESFKSLVFITVVFYGILKIFIVPEVQDYAFQVSRTHIKFHSNWTSSFDKIKHLNELHEALKLPTITDIDISFAMSSLKLEDVKKIFPSQLRAYSRIKINLGSSDLGTRGVQYLLSLIPRNVESLQLYLDSIKADNTLGKPLAQKLNQFSSLTKLRLSLILSSMKDDGFNDFFKTHKISPKLKHLRLVFVGNQLNKTSLENFGGYLKNSNLDSFGLNLYANSIQPEGAKYLADGLEGAKIKDLDIDLYFNNITEVGTEALCQKITLIPNLQKLSLNFDFNYIKNQGGKQIGQMLKKLPQLEELHIGVASKNFGYLGFKAVVDGMATQKKVKSLTLRCGVNRVGVNGASIVNKMLEGFQELQSINIGFVQNYIGDEGINEIAKTVAHKIPKLKNADLDLGFNDAKGFGGIGVLKQLSSRSWNNLQLRLSHNQFRDPDVKLMIPHLKKILKTSDKFIFQFMETAVSKVLMGDVQKLFDQYSGSSKLFINSVIPQAEQQQAQKVARGEKPQKKESVQTKKQQPKTQKTTEKNTQEPKIEKVKTATDQKAAKKQEEQNKKKQQQQLKKQEQLKRKQEQQRLAQQKKRQEEEQKKRQEQQKKKREVEQKRQQQEQKRKKEQQVRIRQEQLKKKREDEQRERMRQQQQDRRQKEQQKRIKEEEQRRRLEQENRRKQQEQERRQKQEQQERRQKQQQNRKKQQEQNRKREEEQRKRQQLQEKKRKEEQQEKRQKQQEQRRVKQQEQRKQRQQEERKQKQQEERRNKQQEERKQKQQEERRHKQEEERRVKQQKQKKAKEEAEKLKQQKQQARQKQEQQKEKEKAKEQKVEKEQEKSEAKSKKKSKKAQQL